MEIKKTIPIYNYVKKKKIPKNKFHWGSEKAVQWNCKTLMKKI